MPLRLLGAIREKYSVWLQTTKTIDYIRDGVLLFLPTLPIIPGRLSYFIALSRFPGHSYVFLISDKFSQFGPPSVTTAVLLHLILFSVRTEKQKKRRTHYLLWKVLKFYLAISAPSHPLRSPSRGRGSNINQRGQFDIKSDAFNVELLLHITY